MSRQTWTCEQKVLRSSNIRALVLVGTANNEAQKKAELWKPRIGFFCLTRTPSGF